MQYFEILNENKGFMMNAYGMNSIMLGLIGIAIIDLILKGWALWRAGRLDKPYWFIALLVVNSAGILPAIFLYITNQEYTKRYPKKLQ